MHGPAGTRAPPAHRHLSAHTITQPLPATGANATCPADRSGSSSYTQPQTPGNAPLPSAQDVTRCRDVLSCPIPAYAGMKQKEETRQTETDTYRHPCVPPGQA